MKQGQLKSLFNLLPRQITLFGPGSKIGWLVGWISRLKKACPTCEADWEKPNSRLRCIRGHWFCFECRLEVITAADCPHCSSWYYMRFYYDTKEKKRSNEQDGEL